MSFLKEEWGVGQIFDDMMNLAKCERDNFANIWVIKSLNRIMKKQFWRKKRTRTLYMTWKRFSGDGSTRYEQNDDFFVRMFSDSDMMKQVMESVGTVLYERLKKKYTYPTQIPELSMVGEETVKYSGNRN